MWNKKKLKNCAIAFVQCISRGRYAVSILLLLALITRIPVIFSTQSTVADEFLYANFAILTNSGIPYFDIHPPFVRMIFAMIVEHAHNVHSLFLEQLGNNFGNFPYIPLRAFVGVFSILLPTLVYVVARSLTIASPYAFLAGMVVVLDNALTLYGGIILPDTILLFLNMLALLGIILAQKMKKDSHSWSLLLASSVIWGFALATKWTALGMIPVFALLLYRSTPRWFLKFIALISGAALVYLSVFMCYFTHFTQYERSVEPVVSFVTMPELRTEHFPDPHNTREILHYVGRMHELMMKESTDVREINNLQKVTTPSAWPLGMSTILYWHDHSGSRAIYLIANIALWSILFFVLLYTLYDLTHAFLRKGMNTLQTHRTSIILITGYLANYLPFFFIERPTYLYHYFTSLLFLILLGAHVLETRSVKFKNNKNFRFTLVLVGTLIVGFYFLALPLTYGL